MGSGCCCYVVRGWQWPQPEGLCLPEKLWMPRRCPAPPQPQLGSLYLRGIAPDVCYGFASNTERRGRWCPGREASWRDVFPAISPCQLPTAAKRCPQDRRGPREGAAPWGGTTAGQVALSCSRTFVCSDGGSKTQSLLRPCWQNPGGSPSPPRCPSVWALKC